jgi:hypothetical protein
MPDRVVHVEVTGPTARRRHAGDRDPGTVTLAQFQDPAGNMVGIIKS